MNNFQNQHLNNQPENQNNQQSANSNLPNQPNQQSSGLMQLVGAVLPALLEHFTGQKMTQNSNSPETQLMLSQILMLQQQIITSQQDLNQRLVNLEMSASQQLTNINQQVQSIKSIRLSHSKETKAIDYNLNQEQETN
jgi:hypothetical protein